MKCYTTQRWYHGQIDVLSAIFRDIDSAAANPRNLQNLLILILALLSLRNPALPHSKVNGLDAKSIEQFVHQPQMARRDIVSHPILRS